MAAPAPDANKAEFKSVEDVEDSSMRSFMYQNAVDQGKSPGQLSTQDFNTLRTDYLQQQVKTLELQLQQINNQLNQAQ